MLNPSKPDNVFLEEQFEGILSEPTIRMDDPIGSNFNSKIGAFVSFRSRRKAERERQYSALAWPPKHAARSDLRN
jgi:hypothetical protein